MLSGQGTDHPWTCGGGDNGLGVSGGGSLKG